MIDLATNESMMLVRRSTLSQPIAAMARSAFIMLTVGAMCVAQAGVALAQSKSVPIVRDAEIEALVTDYATPIIKAAGLSRNAIRIVLVNNNSFNAFVDGRRIFINTGALLQ